MRMLRETKINQVKQNATEEEDIEIPKVPCLPDKE
jgi:hypothetical protein